MELRLAAPEDLQTLHRIERACFPDAWAEEALAGELQREAGLVLLVEDPDPKGYAIFLTVADEAELLRLGVLPEARQQGLGRALLEASWKHLHRRGVVWCHLEVRADNEAAIRLYRRLGFLSTGSRQSYYSDGVDALLMRVHLS